MASGLRDREAFTCIQCYERGTCRVTYAKIKTLSPEELIRILYSVYYKNYHCLQEEQVVLHRHNTRIWGEMAEGEILCESFILDYANYAGEGESVQLVRLKRHYCKAH